MNILFDLGHPAHVHLFKNFIVYLKGEGHNVVVTSREKDLTSYLLDKLGIHHVSISRAKSGYFNGLIELVSRDFKILSLHKKHKFDYAFGCSFSIPHLSALCGVPSFNFCEDDDDIVPLLVNLGYRFSTAIFNPRSIRFSKWPDKRVVYDSYHELAYLHPDNFVPNASVLAKYGLEPLEFILIRKSSLQAYHDQGEGGLERDVWSRLIDVLDGWQLVTSIEGQKSHEVKPEDMHHVLAFAKLVVCDSQTMSMEAAVLGVPSIRYSSFVGRLSCIEELEHRYSLTFGFLPGDDSAFLSKVQALLGADFTRELWFERRARMLHDKVDFTAWLIEYFNNDLART